MAAQISNGPWKVLSADLALEGFIPAMLSLMVTQFGTRRKALGTQIALVIANHLNEKYDIFDLNLTNHKKKHRFSRFQICFQMMQHKIVRKK